MIFMGLFGSVQPYKSAIPNILEVAIAADVLIMLLFKNTSYIYEYLQVLPKQASQATNNSTTCADNDDIEGLSPLVIILTPLYYLPLLVTLVGGASWAIYRSW